EYTLAKNVDLLCGAITLDLSVMRFVAMYILTSGWKLYLDQFLPQDWINVTGDTFLAPKFTISACANPQSWRQESVKAFGVANVGSTMIELLSRTVGLICSEPKDKIFAVLGIL